jgi:hypothetical protein
MSVLKNILGLDIFLFQSFFVSSCFRCRIPKFRIQFAIASSPDTAERCLPKKSRQEYNILVHAFLSVGWEIRRWNMIPAGKGNSSTVKEHRSIKMERSTKYCRMLTRLHLPYALTRQNSSSLGLAWLPIAYLIVVTIVRSVRNMNVIKEMLISYQPLKYFSACKPWENGAWVVVRMTKKLCAHFGMITLALSFLNISPWWNLDRRKP